MKADAEDVVVAEADVAEDVEVAGVVVVAEADVAEAAEVDAEDVDDEVDEIVDHKDEVDD